jgi:hypothetical protein
MLKFMENFLSKQTFLVKIGGTLSNLFIQVNAIPHDHIYHNKTNPIYPIRRRHEYHVQNKK